MKSIKGISALVAFIMATNITLTLANEVEGVSTTVKYSNLADFNNDEEVNYEDYNLLEDYILGKVEEMPCNYSFGLFNMGDLNGDYEITSTDQAILKRYLLGRVENFEVESKIITSINNKKIVSYEGQELTVPDKVIANMYDNSKKEFDVKWNLDGVDINTSSSYKAYGIVEGYDKQVILDIFINEYNPDINIISGIIDGINIGDKAIVTIVNDKYIDTVESDENGFYKFTNIPNGEYLVKIDVNGYNVEKSKKISVFNNINMMSLETSNDSYSNIGQVDFEVEEFTDSKYRYHWEQDNTVSGYEQSSNIVNKPIVEFIDEKVDVGDSNAINKLLHNYNIILSDENIKWSQEYSQRFLEIMDSIPQEKIKHNGAFENKSSKWILTNEHLDNDINIVYGEEGDIIIISKDAFINETPRLAKIEGIQKKYYSKKLHFALLRYVTKDGTDIEAVEKILNDRFGVTTSIESYEELTKNTTKEDSFKFQNFKPNELLYLINIFEEIPEGFHVVKGLKYLVRRVDGMPHPLYQSASVVAWPDAAEESYIEFMDSAFMSDDSYIHRLIIHEKAHFMWRNLFSEDIKKKWIEIAGWYEDTNNPDGWSTTKTTDLVSDYAHGKNPDEDMAETIAYYITDPDKLKSSSIDKYNFVRNCIMHGDIYISQIREDLTFEVLNLYPDYNYPGKIKRIDITVDGNANEDKLVTVEIELNILNKVFDRASYAYTRIYSEIGTFNDFYMYPVNEEGSILRGTIDISKYSKSGYWYTDRIVVIDSAGNQRFDGMDDFGWKLYINNEDEDIIAPEYVQNSLDLNVTEELIENRKVKKLNVSWDVNENKAMKDYNGVYASLINKDTIQYRMETWGIYNLDSKKANIEFYLTEYMQSGRYGVLDIMMVDQANNVGHKHFSDSDQDEKIKTVEIVSENPDSAAPEIDLNKIYVKATPTKPEAPDGETLVEITYYAKDDKSGLGQVGYILRDPQGIAHAEYHYHENFYTMFFNGDPTAWKEYKINVVLPRGSSPGIWGLETINVMDKAGNRKSYNFAENINFQVNTNSNVNISTLDETSEYDAIINFESVEAKQGDEIIVPIILNNYTNEGINNFNFTIKFNQEDLELIDVLAGIHITNAEDIKYNILDNGTAYIMFNDETQGSRNINNNGNVLNLKFKINENADKSVQYINIVEDSFRNKDIANINLKQLKLNIESGKIDLIGYAKTDVDLSGETNVLDLAKVSIKYNKNQNDSEWEEILDINKDGIIDIFDLILISKKL